MNAAIYLRVSTEKQDAQNQRPALEQLCRAREWDFEVREEIASGAKKRPVLDALYADAQRGKVGAVVVWALDRLGRNRVEQAHRARQLAHSGVRLVSYVETWVDQPAGPTRDLLIEVFVWIAEQERKRISERTHEGLKRAAAKGRHPGRPRVPVEALQRAAAMVDAGAPLRAAARAVRYDVQRVNRKTGERKTVRLEVSPAALSRYLRSRNGPKKTG